MAGPNICGIGGGGIATVPPSFTNGLAFGMSTAAADNSGPLQAAINATPAGGTLYIPTGIYQFASGVTVQGKYINLVGDAVGLSEGTQLQRTADIVLLTVAGTSASYVAFNGTGITLTSSGSAKTTSAMASFSYLVESKIHNMNFDGSGVDTSIGLDLQAVQDTEFIGCRWRGIGSGTNGSLQMEQANAGFSCNDLRFVACHWEWNGSVIPTFLNVLGGIGGGQNNSLDFTNCKFETNASGSVNIISMTDVSRINFADGCRLTNHGSTTSAISITTAQYVNLGFLVLTTNVSSQFFNTVNVNGLTVKARGSNIGTYVVDPTCTRVKLDIEYDSTQSLFSMLPLDGNQAYGVNYLNMQGNTNAGVSAVAATSQFLGYTMQGNSTDNAEIFKVTPSTHSQFLNGGTFRYNALCNSGSSSSSLSVQVRFRSASGTNTVVSTQAVSTTAYTWYQATFSPDQLSQLGGYIQVGNATGFAAVTGFVSISEMYWEPVWYGSSSPSSGTWTQGAHTFNSAPTATSVAMWFCTAAGSPGTWTGLVLP